MTWLILRILRAKLQFGCDAYERVDRMDVAFRRPLLVLGPKSDKVAELIAKGSRYTLCKTFEQVLETCSKVSFMHLLLHSHFKFYCWVFFTNLSNREFTMV